MKKLSLIIAVFVASLSAYAQEGEVLAKATEKNATTSTPPQKVVIVTGARFSYKLVQRWIDEYNKVNADVQIIIDSRGSSDPAQFDVLAEVYQHDETFKKSREYINIGRYAVLPVANKASEFANIYTKKGLNNELIKQLYFHNIFADKSEETKVKAAYTVYTRLQKAGVPIVFSRYFGFEQKDINGKSIAGSDEHLLKAILRDSTGLSYLPIPIIYDYATKKPVEGLVVLPVDADGNGKVSDDEKFYDNLGDVIQKLEAAKELKNIPVEYLHLSIDKKKASPEAVSFLKWVNENGGSYLHEYGYLTPESKHYAKEKFNEFASKRGN